MQKCKGIAIANQKGGDIPVTLSVLMEQMIRDEPVDVHEAILHHAEGVDLIPSNIELSGKLLT